MVAGVSDPHKAMGAVLGGLLDYCDEHAARVKAIMDAMPGVRRDPVAAAVDPCRECAGKGSVRELVDSRDYRSPRYLYGPCYSCGGTGTKTLSISRALTAAERFRAGG